MLEIPGRSTRPISPRLALIISYSEYQDPGLQQLVAPSQDAADLARVLADGTIGDFEVQTFINRPSYEVHREIESFFAGRKRDDLLLLYFSGHGIKDEDGRLYLATTDTRRKLLRSTAVPTTFINEVMTASRSRRQVLILDCCYSGAFARGMVAKGSESVDIRSRFGGRGQVVLTSSNALQYAFEGDEIIGEGIRSVFTHYLVRGLETGEADLNGDGWISLDELYDYVYERVIAETPQQTPGKWTFDLQGEIVIARNPLGKPEPAQPRAWFYMATGDDERQVDLLARGDRLTWGANRHTRAGDLVLMYRTAPYSDIAYLFRAQTDARPAEKTATWRWDYAIELNDKLSLERPVTLAEMRAHPRLADWSLARNPQGALRRKRDIREEGYWEPLRGMLVARNPVLAAPLAGWENVSQGELMEQALATARAIEDESERAETLAGMAPHLPDPLRGETLREALEAAQAIGDARKRAETLEQHARFLAKRFGDDTQVLGLAAEAWAAAAGIFDAEGEPERAAACQREVARWLQQPVITLDVQHEGLVLDAWSRLQFTVRNEGYGPARNLIIRASGDEFEGQVTSTRQIATLRAGRERTDWLDVRPLAYGDSVPLRVSVEYEDRAGEPRSLRHIIYLTVARGEATRREGETIRVFTSNRGARQLEEQIPPLLRAQLAEARENLLLIRERKSQYMLETDVPLDLIKEERGLEQYIADLEARLAQLGDVTIEEKPSPKVVAIETSLHLSARTVAVGDELEVTVRLRATALPALTVYPVTALNLRAQPTTDSPQIGRALLNQPLTVVADDVAEARARIGQMEQWFQVRAETGEQAWAAAWYLSLMPVSEEKPASESPDFLGEEEETTARVVLQAIPDDGELMLSLSTSAADFELDRDTATIPLDTLTDGESVAASFRLTPRQPDPATIAVELALGTAHQATLTGQVAVVAPNPFYDRGRISDPARFFGREDIVRDLVRRLQRGENISLIGDRRAGKSSLLYYLYATRREWMSNYVDRVVYLDCQLIPNSRDFYAALTEALGGKGDDALAFVEATEKGPAILFLDEFEVLVNLEDTRVLQVLRSVLQRPNIGSIVATERPLYELIEPGDASPLGNIFYQRELSPFSPTVAREFLAARLAGTGVTFNEEEINHLVQESEGCPGRLTELAADLYMERTSFEARITPPEIEPAKPVHLLVEAVSPEVGYLNVRPAPSTEQPPVTRVGDGTVLEALEPEEATQAKVRQKGQWLYVRTPDGVEGYVAAWYLRLHKVEEEEEKREEVEKVIGEPILQVVVHSATGLNVRREPGPDTPPIWHVGDRTVLEVLEDPADVSGKIGKDRWLKVRTPSLHEGYVNGLHVRASRLADERAPVNDAALQRGECAWIFGIHGATANDSGDFRHLFAGTNKTGWVLFTETIGADPHHGGGHDVTMWSNSGYGVITRLNHSHESGGTLPVRARYADFAQACARYVQNSQGCHIWIIGNEQNNVREHPGGAQNPIEHITPQLYAEAFNLARQRIKQVQPEAIVVPGALDPYNTYPWAKMGNRRYRPLEYFEEMLSHIDDLDGIALHTYTHWLDAGLITRPTVFQDEFLQPGTPHEHYYDFLAYRSFAEAIPDKWRDRPIYITETNHWLALEHQPSQLGEESKIGWMNVDKGWVQAAYAEINRWNSIPHAQQIHCLLLYCWTGDAWAIEDREEIHQDFRKALARDYAWRREARPSVPYLEPAVAYDVLLGGVPSEPIRVGEELKITVCLRPAGTGDGNGDAFLLELPQDEAIGGELNVLLTAPGFQFDGDNAESLPLDPGASAGIAAQPLSQEARFQLIALRPGPAKIMAELYRGDVFLKSLEADLQVAGFDKIALRKTRVTPRPRPVPHPDLVLQVRTDWDETRSACTLFYYLNSFRPPLPFAGGIEYRSDPLPAGWIERTRGLLGATLEEMAGGLAEDARRRLASLGRYMFQSLFPPELQNDLCNRARFGRTLLILADQDGWLPWELLHDGRAFLGERFIVGRWPRELDDARPYEFPVGAVSVAHFAGVEQPQAWAALLEPPGAPPPSILPGGMFGDLGKAESMRGLHQIRFGQPPGAAGRRDAPTRLDATERQHNVERQLRPVKLNLRRNRPLVTLGYISAGQPELTTLEQTWASTFVRARCSAFVGPLWAVDAATEAAFTSGLYSHLWAGESLGGAFQAGRRLAQAAAPESLDWLAYVLFGDPMARPYRPVEGQGYAVVEPIGREMDDPLPPGARARFRVSLRRAPPVWHADRVIKVAEELAFKDLLVHVKAFDVQVTPPVPIVMARTPAGDYLGWFTLAAPPEMAGDSADVDVFFVDGRQLVHSLTFPLKIGAAGGDQS